MMTLWLTSGIGLALVGIMFLESPPTASLVIFALSVICFYKGTFGEESSC